ncbi:M14 family metallopeptidase [Intestinibacter sp.]
MKNNTWNLLGHEIEASSKLQTMLHPYDENYEIPATIINGANQGKTIFICAGSHSGEYPGIAASSIVAQQIDPAKVSGRIIFIHCLNSSGFLGKRERFVPEDGGNLNDVFPGDKQGTISKKIAAFLEYEIMKEADFVVDLHSGQGEQFLAPCIFFPTKASEEINKISLEVAKITTIPNLIASTSKTGVYSYATTIGIPGILIERGATNLCERENYEAYVEDIYAILNYFNVVEKTKDINCGVKIIWHKSEYIDSNHTGLWYSDLKPGMILKKGDLVGIVKDFFGNVLAEYRVSEDCRVMYNYVGLMINENSNIGAFGILKHAELVD